VAADDGSVAVIRVLLVDDETLVRAGLQLLLSAAPDILVFGEAGDGERALTAARALRPDIVLLDIRMPGIDGIAVARQLRQLPTPPRIIMLTTFDLGEQVVAALRAGAAGFLLKDTPPAQLLDAVRTVAAGQAILSPSVTTSVVNHVAATTDPQATQAYPELDLLSDRERAVLRLVGAGMSNADIAGRLHLAEATVKTHVGRILAKLGLANRVQAAILAHESGLANRTDGEPGA